MPPAAAAAATANGGGRSGRLVAVGAPCHCASRGDSTKQHTKEEQPACDSGVVHRTRVRVVSPPFFFPRLVMSSSLAQSWGRLSVPLVARATGVSQAKRGDDGTPQRSEVTDEEQPHRDQELAMSAATDTHE